jgi:hypothetical protein
MPSPKRQKILEAKCRRKEEAMKRPGLKSKYAQKVAARRAEATEPEDAVMGKQERSL